MVNMRRSWVPVAVLSILAGCQVATSLVPGESPAAGRSAAAGKATPRPSVGPVAPSAAASPTAEPRILRRPASPVRTLTGSVAIDASYAAGAGGGQVVSNNGSRVLNVGGTALLSNHGASLISDNGAALGGALIGSLRGSSLIGKIRYRLAQAEAPEVGVILPSAGMAVRVFSLASGSFLALGTDAEGQQVYEVLSDAAGRYEVFLPATEAGTVLIVARPPGSDDPRLLYQLAASGTSGDGAVTEESSYATYYVKLGIARAMYRWVSGASGGAAEPGALTPAEFADVVAGREKLRLAGATHTAKLPEGERLALAARLAEIAMARIDLQAIQTGTYTRLGAYAGPVEPAVPAFAAILGGYREAVTARMREVAARGEDPFAFFAGRPYFVRANAGRATPFSLRKPMDFVDFVVDQFMANDDPLAAMTSEGYREVGRDIPLGDLASYMRLDAALSGTKAAIDRALYLEPRGIFPALQTAIEQANPDARPAP